MSKHDAAPDTLVENALLRGSLYLAANVLKDHHGARLTKAEDGRLQLVVPESVRDRAAVALEKAKDMLQEQGRGR